MAANFALTPASANPGIIDYTTVAGRKMSDNATKKLTSELFDCVPENLFSFLKALKDRARDNDWSGGQGILDILRDPTDPTSATDDLLELYGNITLENIKKFEETYIGNHCRSAQDTYNLYSCLMKSISEEGKAKVLIWEAEYTVGTKVSGCLLLKVIIRESHLDSNATTSSIRGKLSSLDEYLPQIGNNITKLNQYVKLMVQALGARNEKTEDLLANLFKGYLACSDATFVAYIEKKQDAYDEGTEIRPDLLMNLANDKFKLLTLKGKWEAPSQQEEKILALEAKINALKGNNRVYPKLADPKKYPNADQNKKPDWMEKPPQDGVNSKMWKAKLWHYCHPSTGGKCDGQWRVHKPTECKGTAFKETFAAKMALKRKAQKEATPVIANPSTKKYKIKRAAAYQATQLGWSDHDDAFLTDTPLSQQDDDGSTDDGE